MGRAKRLNLVFATALLCACLPLDARQIECATDADCPAADQCVYRVCVSRALVTADAAASDARGQNDGASDVAASLDAPDTCPANTVWCADGCYDLGITAAHCGACDAACAPPLLNEVVACVERACVVQCEAGWTDVLPTPGCETECERVSEERCDGLDNDCDGLVDAADPDLVTPPCTDTPDVGVCEGAREGCLEGALVACDESVLATYANTNAGAPYASDEEVWCDGYDNDCDGLTDETCCPDAPALPVGDADAVVSPFALAADGARLTLWQRGGALQWTIPALGTPTLTTSAELREILGPCGSAATLASEQTLAGNTQVALCGAEAVRTLVGPTGEVLLTDGSLATLGRPVAAGGARLIVPFGTTLEQQGWVATNAGGATEQRWPVSLASPLRAVALDDTMGVVVHRADEGTIALHPLDDEGRLAGTRDVIAAPDDGLDPALATRFEIIAVDGVPMLAFTLNEALYTRPLRAAPDEPLAAPTFRARFDAQPSALRAIPSDRGSAVFAVAANDTLHLFSETSAPRTAPLDGAREWRAALLGEVLVLATLRPEGWVMTRFSPDGGRLCP